MLARFRFYGQPCLKQYANIVSSVRHVSSTSRFKGNLTDVVNMASIWTNPAIPFKIGYTDKMPDTPELVVSSGDENLLLQYWPKKFMFQAADVSCSRDAFKQFTASKQSWTKSDLERHDDLISHESFLYGRQDVAERRLHALLACESVFLVDDLTETLVASDDKLQEAMAFDFILHCRDIMNGTADELDGRFDSLYKGRFPQEYEDCRYLADFNTRLYQGFKNTMSSDMLNVLAKAYSRSYHRTLDEYKFWKDATLRNEHATLDKFIHIKSESSFFAVCSIVNYNDSDLEYISFDHSIQTLTTMINQACNDLFSYPKEQEAGLNPFNMLQKAIMADKMSVKEALITNIQRRNDYMRALEVSYDVLSDSAKRAAEAPLTIMAGWEKYFSGTRRYGWTDVGAINN
ncbi:hypothetical protein HDE_06202 [Halotydeus destructor]|nr:hypothetical protein HDE_06202 [Halotydeus destructor]